MKRGPIQIIAVIVLVAGAGVGGYFLGRPSGGAASADASAAADAPPVVAVQVVPVRRGTIAQTATAYGTVQSEPGATAVVSLPFESRVTAVLATPGQTVAADTPVVEAEPSPDAKLQLQQAKNDLAAADRNLKQVQAKLKAQLATNSELSQAEQARQSAQTQLNNLQQRGSGGKQTLTAGVAGVVGRIEVQQGALVAAGSPMASVSPRDRTEVKLGVEPEDAALLKVDQSVELHDVHADAGDVVTGTIRLIATRVNPDTRLTDVYVTLPPTSPLVIDAFVSATLQTRRADGLIVPRDAVLPVEGKMILYTAAGGKASRHEVSLGLENDREVQLTAGGVGEGDSAVVVGNAELQDGMAVDVQPTPTTAEAK